MAHPFNARSFAIVPAAGRSRRMGSPKLLLPWQGSTIIEHVLATWKATPVSRVVVVVHPDDHELACTCRGARVDVVVPAEPPPDMKASVGHGLEFLRREEIPTAADAWLLAPADMPLLTIGHIGQVLAAHDPAAPCIVVPRHAGRRGHPVLFPWSSSAEVQRLGSEEGLNRLLEQFDVREIAMADPGILADIDTPDDYRALRERGP